jgi:hypothetical protein
MQYLFLKEVHKTKGVSTPKGGERACNSYPAYVDVGSSIGLRPPKTIVSPSPKLDKLTQEEVVRAKKTDELNGRQMCPPTHL